MRVSVTAEGGSSVVISNEGDCPHESVCQWGPSVSPRSEPNPGETAERSLAAIEVDRTIPQPGYVSLFPDQEIHLFGPFQSAKRSGILTKDKSSAPAAFTVGRFEWKM